MKISTNVNNFFQALYWGDPVDNKV